MKKLSIIFRIVLCALIVSASSLTVFADETVEDEKAKVSSPALQISPVTARISLDPSQVLEKSFEVKNTGSEPFEFRVYATPYSTKDNHYNLDFETETNYTQISRWIKFFDADENLADEAKFNLLSGETKTVRYQITVPEDVAGGGQYASIFAETTTDEVQGSGIKTVSRAGLIVYASMSGETRREVKIGDMSLDSFLFGGNVNIHANVENTGNIDFQTSTEITIKSIFGKELYTNTTISTLLPETKRQLDTEWSNTPIYGLFRLHYKLSALGTEMESEHLILVMPPYMLIITIVLLTCTIIVLVAYIRKKKANGNKGEKCEILYS